jgi:hypothetical protein
MAKKGDHDGKSGRSDDMAGNLKQHGNKNDNSRTGSKQNGGHGGHR